MKREALAEAAERLGPHAVHKGRLVAASLDTLSHMPVDALVAFVFSDVAPLTGSVGLVDWYLCGTLTRAIRSGMFTAAPRERLLIPTFGRLRPKMVFTFGLGPVMDCDSEQLRRIGAQALAVCREAGAKRVAGCMPHPEIHASALRMNHAVFCGETLQTELTRPDTGVSAPTWLIAPDGVWSRSETKAPH